MLAILRYLLFGPTVLYLPKSWLANTDRLALYEAYTKRQWQQGSVVKDVAATRRDAFWEARVNRPAAKVTKFPERLVQR